MPTPDYRYVLHDNNDTDVDSLDFANGPAYVPYASPVLHTSAGSRFGRFKHLAKRIARAPVVLLNAVPTATLTLIAPWPLNGSKLSMVASAATGHTDCSGRVTINGTENYDFLQAGTKQSTVSLTSIPTITTANLDCNLKISVVGSGNQPIYLDTETDLPCKIEVKSKSIPDPSGGWTSIRATQIQARGIFEIGDNIKFDIDYPFDPTNGTTQPIAAWRPKTAYAGKESIKILEF